MSRVSRRIADKPFREPGPEVCLIKVVHNGEIVRRIPEGAAAELVKRGWAAWLRTGSRRHLALTEAAPISALRASLRGDGTRPATASGIPLPGGRGRDYKTGQRLGASRSTREFRPLR